LTFQITPAEAAGTADSTTYATNYRVDTAKINLRNSIAGKLSPADTVNKTPRIIAGPNITVTGTFPNVIVGASGTLSGTAGKADTSYYLVDTTINYLSNSGADANNGYTSSTPKATLASLQNLLNAKAASLGKGTLLLEAGSTFTGTFKTSTPRINFGAYNLNTYNKYSLPRIRGSEDHNSGWSATSNYFEKSVSHYLTGTVMGYDYIYVMEIDKDLEKTAPYSAVKYMNLAASTAVVNTTPGSFFIPATSDNPITVSIRPSNSLSPNSNPKYRYEIAVRSKGIDGQSANVNGNYQFNNFSYLDVYGFTGGYGGMPSGLNANYDHIIFHPAGAHNIVIGSGTVANSAFFESAPGINTASLIYYSPAGNQITNRVYNTIFHGSPHAIGLHTSNIAPPHKGITIENVLSFGDTLARGSYNSAFIFANNTDSATTMTNIYATNQPIFSSQNGTGPTTILKNSVLQNVTQFGFLGGNYTVENVLMKHTSVTGGLPLKGFYQNGTVTARNNIIHFNSNSTNFPVWGDQTNPLTFEKNIIILDFPTEQNSLADLMFNMKLNDTARIQNNVYIYLNDPQGVRFHYSGGYVNFAQWKALGYDKNGLVIDLTNDPNKLRAVFVDPYNGDYRLIKGGWGDSIRARGAGMTTPLMRFLPEPTKEQIVQWVKNDAIPIVADLFGRNGEVYAPVIPAVTVPGANTQILRNVNGALGASSDFTYSGPSLTATANNQSMIGLRINPTFNIGSFTGTHSTGLLVNGGISNTATHTTTNSVVSGGSGLEIVQADDRWAAHIKQQNSNGGGMVIETNSGMNRALFEIWRGTTNLMQVHQNGYTYINGNGVITNYLGLENGSSFVQHVSGSGARIGSGSGHLTVMYNSSDVVLGGAAGNFGKLNVPGTISQPSSTKTADYTITKTDYLLMGNATSGNITFTLPHGNQTGVQFIIKKIDASANTVTLQGQAGQNQTIDGQATHVLSTQNKFVTVISDGNLWRVIGGN
jgi:hypothetical protein